MTEPPRHDPDRPVYEHGWEDALEPKHLIRRSDMVLRVGREMLASGTGARRVAEAMWATARALDIDDLHARIDLTSIVLSVRRRGIFRTQVTRVLSPGVDADRIAALQSFSRHLEPHMTVAEVERRLDEIAARPRRWPGWAIPLASGLACCAFAVLNNASTEATIAVFCAAAAGQALRRKLHGWHVNVLATVFLAAVLAGAVFVGVTALVGAVTHVSQVRYPAGFISAILFLIPGFPLMTALLDLARIDLPSGVPRLAYAMLLTFAAGLGAWVVAGMAGVSPEAAPPYALGHPALLGLRIAASFLGVFGFAVIFNSPPLVAVAAGCIAMVANPIRLELVGLGWAPQNAAALGTLLIGLLAVVAGKAFHLPRIILSVPSVVIMIPGAAAFRSLALLESGQLVASLEQGVTATLVVIGMAAGLVGARMLTDPEWAFADGRPRRLPLPHRRA